jgi:ABC-type polysaccharide/polyol phosphate transport system ATPase subunit
MSAAPAIQLDSVSVRYRVPQERVATIKEYAIRLLQRKLSFRSFNALDDVSLSVLPGEVFGVIGHNGAGKSTLLKVVARVLRPTAGRVRTNGRIAPLLELGAGFDNELTGRENVYLNAAIMGFTRAQIDGFFPRIVEFSALQQFIDAPLRTYSSGMVARLGFAAATVERPDILIVDEILGVGDAEFQAKSYERIQQFRRAGTTILLVTHNLQHIPEMCSRALWLDRGRAMAAGAPADVVAQYREHTLTRAAGLAAGQTAPAPGGLGASLIRIEHVRLTDERGIPQTTFAPGGCLRVEMDYVTRGAVDSPIFGVAIHRADGVHVAGPNSKFGGERFPPLEGSGSVIYTIPQLNLLEGLYQLSAAVTNYEDTVIYDYHDQQYPFRVIHRGGPVREKFGLMAIGGTWELRQGGGNG